MISASLHNLLFIWESDCPITEHTQSGEYKSWTCDYIMHEKCIVNSKKKICSHLRQKKYWRCRLSETNNFFYLHMMLENLWNLCPMNFFNFKQSWKPMNISACKIFEKATTIHKNELLQKLVPMKISAFKALWKVNVRKTTYN